MLAPWARPRKRVIGLVVGGVLVWVVVVTVVVPWIIRTAHAGRSLAIFNDMISGRDDVPLGRYLAEWWGLSLRVSGLAAAVLIGATILWLFRKSLKAWVDRDLLEPAASMLDLIFRPLGIFVSLGFLAGAVESSIVLARFWLPIEPPWEYSLDVGWMAPIGGALAFGLLGLAVTSASLCARRAFRVPVLMTIASGYLVFGLLRYVIPGLYTYAAVVLSAGIGVMVARAVRGWGLSGRVLTLGALGGTVLLGLGVTGMLHLSRPNARGFVGPAATGANVLLLILDTVRASGMSVYGYAKPTTPNLERIGSEGVVYDMAIAPSSWTLSSHATLLTGRWPHELELGWERPFSGRELTLAEAFSASGWSTGGFVANYYYGIEFFGLGRGFQQYRVQPVAASSFVRNSWFLRTPIERVLRARGDRRQYDRKAALDVNEEFLDWLDGRSASGRPFFAFLNYIDAHDPYTPPAEFRAQFGWVGGLYWLKSVGSTYSKEEIQQLRNAYDASVAYVDHAVGKLTEELRARGVLDNTIVVVTSDHGEEFSEYGLMGHSYSLNPASIHVPLIIRYPPAIDPGVRISQPVTLRDVPTTLALLAGLGGEKRFPGNPLPLDSGMVVGTTDVRAELEPHLWKVPVGYPARDARLRSVFLGDLQFVRSGEGVETVFRLGTDSSIRESVSNLDSSTLTRLRAAEAATRDPE